MVCERHQIIFPVTSEFIVERSCKLVRLCLLRLTFENWLERREIVFVRGEPYSSSIVIFIISGFIIFTQGRRSINLGWSTTLIIDLLRLLSVFLNFRVRYLGCATEFLRIASPINQKVETRQKELNSIPYTCFGIWKQQQHGTTVDGAQPNMVL